MADDPRSAARPVYTIGAVARMLDVRTSTLRSWEERYGLVVPDRSKGSQRLYSRDQVEQLRFVVEQVDAGLQAGEAHRLLAAGHGATPSERGEGDDRPQVLILVAERDPFAAELTEFFLRTEGYEVVVAFDAADAAAQSHRLDLDLAIVELLLSAPAAGTALCTELRERGVVVVATSTLDLGAEALLAGAEAFLAKPFEPLQLVSMVRDLLGDSALTRARHDRAVR